MRAIHSSNQQHQSMNPPKIVSAQAIDDLTLIIEFSNQDRKQYSIARLLDKPMFLPLRNPSFFKNFHVDDGGYGIVWNDEIDLSEYELWQNGTDVVVGETSESPVAKFHPAW